MKPYIEKAKELYSKILNYDIQTYCPIIFSCLYDLFDIKTSQQIDILAAVIKKQYSYGVRWKKNDIINSIQSYDEQEEGEFGSNYEFREMATIDQQCADLLKDRTLSQVHKNTLHLYNLYNCFRPLTPLRTTAEEPQKKLFYHFNDNLRKDIKINYLQRFHPTFCLLGRY